MRRPEEEPWGRPKRTFHPPLKLGSECLCPREGTAVAEHEAGVCASSILIADSRKLIQLPVTQSRGLSAADRAEKRLRGEPGGWSRAPGRSNVAGTLTGSWMLMSESVHMSPRNRRATRRAHAAPRTPRAQHDPGVSPLRRPRRTYTRKRAAGSGGGSSRSALGKDRRRRGLVRRRPVGSPGPRGPEGRDTGPAGALQEDAASGEKQGNPAGLCRERGQEREALQRQEEEGMAPVVDSGKDTTCCSDYTSPSLAIRATQPAAHSPGPPDTCRSTARHAHGGLRQLRRRCRLPGG